MKAKFKDYLEIIIGSTLFALGIVWFADPMELVVGGVSGISIIVKSFLKIPLYITNLALNIPIFLIAVKQRGFKFIFKSMISVLWSSLIMEIATFIPNPFNISEDIFLTSVMTGVFAGVGLGLVLRATATTGGTDMLASIIKYIKPHLDISRVLFVIDAIIIVTGMTVFGVTKGLYAVIAIMISTVIINLILDGAHFARGVLILSEKFEEISKAVFDELNRGNTSIPAKGMYTKEDKNILFVVVNPKEIITLQNIVKNIDSNAFMTIFDVRKTLGEGFFDFKDLDKKL